LKVKLIGKLDTNLKRLVPIESNFPLNAYDTKNNQSSFLIIFTIMCGNRIPNN